VSILAAAPVAAAVPAPAPVAPAIATASAATERHLADIKVVERYHHLTNAGRKEEARVIASGPFHEFPMGALGTAGHVFSRVVGDRSTNEGFSGAKLLGHADTFDAALAKAGRLVDGTTANDRHDFAVTQAAKGFDVLDFVTNGGGWAYPVASGFTEKSNFTTDRGSFPIETRQKATFERVDPSLQAIVGRDWAGAKTWADFRGGDEGVIAPLA
jgi:hypothetical protein